ncbi:hypothetical protein COU62_01385 [Candidatus Pacearchaeota archaeon CG10_big_fil_rev_8_21_14_0_10_35_219]|nr:hypothetical protein [Candidatus Pacearchaeota archaeon]OIO43376.1 MAG: hypothetical protein AUJ63_00610 [Candidatus Pacearchaeota archaeon CG1_02_35_32]PIO08020.1 MAG: hypothetical protein COU62_01385 [Candidatus Pacearchaeota archaeon CG10_big_fil_rev_8_21_14_0_10_35_219]PIY81532.1 MAG: hypothetical protein COY79_02225 [Candidatus Pacearchaeota archaeon CG_4_10_14_0_8_um_filter_35_169]PIZ78907.1 MAG: hypothetical protein COY00_04610 [Candidatus Pacearchaeota archaeon CG_4_10_14_0_2_um_filt
MFEELRENIRTQEGLIRELGNFYSKLGMSNQEDTKLIMGIIDSIIKRIRISNQTIPELVRHVTLAKQFTNVKVGDLQKAKKIQKVNLGNKEVAVKSKDKKKFIEELNISKSLIRRLQRSELKQEEETSYGAKRAGFYSKIANKIFLKKSQDWLERGLFRKLVLDIRKSNINILSPTYISIMFLTPIIMIFVSLLLAIFLLFFSAGFTFPFITTYEGSLGIRILQTWWIIIAIPIFTWVSFYFYPTLEKKSLGTKIDQELPFMVIQMGSIAGSGIEPVEIFKIIGLGKDYRYAGKEVRKLLNQINIYGYDLVTALTNIANSTPSKKLSELFGGLAITISSGGQLETFFEKRADSLLLEYSLERERFTKVAETFMDIYISVVIATPMILLLLLIMVSVSGIGVGGLGITQLTTAIILLVAVVNVIFLIFLNMKQPSY